MFWCPGCKSSHAINSHPNGPKWEWNGDIARPTFKPSILVTLRWSEVEPGEKDEICHSFVTAGQIQFLGDCTHELAGQTVPLPKWPYAPGTYGGLDEGASQ